MRNFKRRVCGLVALMLLSLTGVAHATPPTLSASDETLHWTGNAKGKFVEERHTPGGTTEVKITGTTDTPPVVPDATADYRVKASGGKWSNEVSITYKALFGVNVGEIYPINPADLEVAVKEGAKLVRSGVAAGQEASKLPAEVLRWAEKGVKVQLLAYSSGGIPTEAEAKNLGSIAKAVGPDAKLWEEHPTLEQYAVTDIELGNEVIGNVGGEDAKGGAFEAYAKEYARKAKVAAESLKGTGVRLLIDDESRESNWMRAMYEAVNLNEYVSGWILHPYGTPTYAIERVGSLESQKKEHGSTAPVYLTEWGVASEDGLEMYFEGEKGEKEPYNEGWSPSLPYETREEKPESSLAKAIEETWEWLKPRLGANVAEMLIYQTADQGEVGGPNHSDQYFYGIVNHKLESKGRYTTMAESLMSSGTL